MQLSHKPEPHTPVEVFQLPDGKTDVFLRRNETTETDEEGNIIYVAEELYFRSDESITAEYAEANFEQLWQRQANPLTEAETYEQLKERLELVEGALNDIVMLMYQ